MQFFLSIYNKIRRLFTGLFVIVHIFSLKLWSATQWDEITLGDFYLHSWVSLTFCGSSARKTGIAMMWHSLIYVLLTVKFMSVTEPVLTSSSPLWLVYQAVCYATVWRGSASQATSCLLPLACWHTGHCRAFAMPLKSRRKNPWQTPKYSE